MTEVGGTGRGVVNNPFGLGMVARARARLPDNVVPLPLPLQPPARRAPQDEFGPGVPMGIAPGGPPMAMLVPVPAPGSDPGTAPRVSRRPMIGRDMSIDELIKLQRKLESGGNYQAVNRDRPGNTASGAYQYTDATWNNYGGYPKAVLAPKEVQDRRFREDVIARVRQFDGDVFRAVASHYLPAYANRPDTWDRAQRVKGRNVEPVATYLKRVFRGSPYEGQVDAYIAAHRE